MSAEFDEEEADDGSFDTMETKFSLCEQHNFLVEVSLKDSELRFGLGSVGGDFLREKLFHLGDLCGDVRDERARVASTRGLRNDSDKGLCGSGFAFIVHSAVGGLRQPGAMSSTGSDDNETLGPALSSVMLDKSRRHLFRIELL